MSLRTMVWVLEESEAQLGDRLVLLVLAEHAGDEGDDAYPSQETIANKTRLSERQVRRCLANLERDGRITRDGATRYGTVRWQIVMTPDNMSARTSATPSADKMSPEPSLNRSKDLEVPDLSLTAERTTDSVRAYDPVKGAKIEGRNLPYDALAETTGADPKYDSGPLAAALAKIRRRAVGHARENGAVLDVPLIVEHALATEIRARAAAYRERWPEVELTPTALAKHWDRVLLPQPSALQEAKRYGRGLTPAQVIELTRNR